MSTRSITTVQSRWEDKPWRTHCNIYRHHDGYLDGHGQWLHDFLDGFKVINGKSGKESGKWANGPGRLAAQLVSALQEDDHEPNLVPDSGPSGQEFHYTIQIQFGFQGGEISLNVFDGPMTFFGAGGENCDNQIFSGSVEEYGKFLQSQSAESN